MDSIDTAAVRQLLEEHCWTRSGRRKRCARDCPELLPQVRRRWQRSSPCDAQLDAMFPAPGSTRPPATHRRRPSARRSAPDPRLRSLGGAGARRHGRRLQGPAPAPQPLRRRQNAARRRRTPSPASSERFLREAEAVAGLRHPNIVQVHDMGDARRPALLHDGVRRGRQPGPETGGHAPAAPPGGRSAGDPGRCRPGGPPERDRASRPEAGQRPPDRRRHAQDQRLRAGPTDWTARPASPGAAPRSGRRATWPPSKPRRERATWGRPRTSMRWGQSCTSC